MLLDTVIELDFPVCKYYFNVSIFYVYRAQSIDNELGDQVRVEWRLRAMGLRFAFAGRSRFLTYVWEWRGRIQGGPSKHGRHRDWLGGWEGA